MSWIKLHSSLFLSSPTFPCCYCKWKKPRWALGMNLVAHIQPLTFSRVYLALYVHASQPTTKTDPHCLVALLTFTTATPWYNNISFSTQLYEVCITVHHTMGYTQLAPGLIFYTTKVRTTPGYSSAWQPKQTTQLKSRWFVMWDVYAHIETLQTFTHMYRLSLCYCPYTNNKYNASGQIIMIFYAIAMFVGHCPIFVQITGQWLDMQWKVVYLPG